jgi:signal transduction histidine kinase
MKDVPRRDQQTSLESFLDDYLTIRLVLSMAGTGLLVLLTVLGIRHPTTIPTGLSLLVIAGHSFYSRLRHVRSPHTLLTIDVGLLSIAMQTYDDPAIATATLAFLSLLVVIFGDGWLMSVLLGVLGVAFAAAHFGVNGISAYSSASMVSVLFTVGGVVVVLLRVRRWLRRLDGYRSQMLGTVSHELRNSLTGMLGLTQIVGEMPDLEPAEARELIDLAHHQAVDASEIIDDLLIASRIEHSGLTVDAAEVDLANEISTVANRFAGDGRLTVSVLGDHLPAACGDPLRVRQILRNLISNAIRYGGPHVVLSTLVRGDQIEVTVWDDGDGVPAEDEDTIFLPYRRSASGQRHPSSVGLGLWICRQLATAMRGTLSYSHDAAGTALVLTLPKAGDPALGTSAAIASEQVRSPIDRSLGDGRPSPAYRAS